MSWDHAVHVVASYECVLDTNILNRMRKDICTNVCTHIPGFRTNLCSVSCLYMLACENIPTPHKYNSAVNNHASDSLAVSVR